VQSFADKVAEVFMQDGFFTKESYVVLSVVKPYNTPQSIIERDAKDHGIDIDEMMGDYSYILCGGDGSLDKEVDLESYDFEIAVAELRSGEVFRDRGIEMCHSDDVGIRGLVAMMSRDSVVLDHFIQNEIDLCKGELDDESIRLIGEAMDNHHTTLVVLDKYAGCEIEEVSKMAKEAIAEYEEYLQRKSGNREYGSDPEKDKLVDSADRDERIKMAQAGYGLDKLVTDPDWHVRREVARQGYGLEQLAKDENGLVKNQAVYLLNNPELFEKDRDAGEER
jgi:hypothetical protein